MSEQDFERVNITDLPDSPMRVRRKILGLLPYLAFGGVGAGAQRIYDNNEVDTATHADQETQKRLDFAMEALSGTEKILQQYGDDTYIKNQAIAYVRATIESLSRPTTS